MKTFIENWLDYATEQGLDIVEVTEAYNGYPKNTSKAVIGFDTFEEAQSFADKTDRDIVRMSRRDGHHFWYSYGRTFEPLRPDASWFGDNYTCYENQEQWWSEEKDYLCYYVLGDETEISSEDFKKHINRLIEIYNTFESLDENQQVLLASDRDYPEIIPISTMHFHDGDVTDYVIAVK